MANQSGSTRRLRSQGPADEGGAEENSGQGRAVEGNGGDTEEEQDVVSADEGNGPTGQSRTLAERQDRHVRQRNRAEEIGDIPAPKEKIMPFQIAKLDSSNSRYWFNDMKDQLQLQKVWKAVETYINVGGATFISLRSRYENWETINLKAKMIIRNGLNENQKMDCQPIEDAGEMWQKLLSDYYQRSSGEIATLVARICGWKRTNNKDILGSLRELERMNQEVKDMDRDLGFHEKLLMVMFLRGLGDDFKLVRETIISSGAISRKEVLGRLQAVESERNPSERNPNDQSANRGQNSAGRGRGGGRGRGRRRGQRGGRGGPSQNNNNRDSGCYVCGDEKHYARDCPEKHQEKDQNHNPKKKPNEKKKEGKANRTDHGDDSDNVYDSNKTTLEAEQDTSHRSGSANDFDHGQWCLDSGTTIHVTGERMAFEHLEPCQSTLRTGNGRTKITSQGMVRFMLPNGKFVRINGVAYAPTFGENLISTEQLLESGIGFASDPEDGAWLYRKGEILARGRRENRSIYLDDVASENSLMTNSHSALRANEFEDSLNRKETDHYGKLMHRRLGHPGESRFDRAMISLGSDLRAKSIAKPCLVCTQSRTVKNRNHQKVSRAKRPLERVYMDLWGPYKRFNIDDDRYYLALVDDNTRFSWLFTLQDHKVETIQEILENWLKRVERESGHMVIVIRTDNAAEFKALEKQLGDKYGIEFEYTEPYSPHQNGPPERLNRFILEVSRSLLFDSHLPKTYWKYAAGAANHLRNCTAAVECEDGSLKSPFELWRGRKPDLTKFRVWGCHVEYYEKSNDKLEPRTKGGTLIGYGKSDKQYYVLTDDAKNVRLCTSPIFFENQRSELVDGSPLTRQPPVVNPVNPTHIPAIVGGDESRPTPVIDKDPQESDELRAASAPEKEQYTLNESGVAPGQDLEQDKSSDVPPLEIQPLSVEQDESEHHEQPPAIQSAIDRPRRESKPTQALLESQETERYFARYRRRPEGEELPKSARRQQIQDVRKSKAVQWKRTNEARTFQFASRLTVASELLLYTEDQDDFSLSARRTLTASTEIPIPTTYQDAINQPVYGPKWREAIHEEITSLIKFGTWKPRNREFLKSQNIATTRWVFDIKRGADGRIERFKARLVVRGFTQREGVDFESTFAPVFRLESLRILLAMAAQYGLWIHLLDAKNAFVGSEIDVPNYIEVPEGVEQYEGTNQSEYVLELVKSLYGLRQSAHLWNEKFKAKLFEMGFKESTADSSVLVSEQGVVIALYVDDVLVMGRSSQVIKDVKRSLKAFHPMKDFGIATKILGIRIEQKEGYIRIDQKAYTCEILQEFGFENCKPQRTPLSPSVKLEGETPNLGYQDHQLYRRIIGRVSFLVLATRVDLAFPTNRLAQYLARPQKVHLEAGKHILRYLRGTITFALTYWRDNKMFTLVGFADSSFANATGNRSTGGYVFFLNEKSSPVCWNSRKQAVVAQSTVEAEYMALAEAMKQAIWIRHLLYTVNGEGQRSSLLIYEDNQGSIKLATNPRDHARTKHIMVRYHALRDAVARGDVQIEYKPTGEMVADGLTKPLTPESMKKFLDGLRMRGYDN